MGNLLMYAAFLHLLCTSTRYWDPSRIGAALLHIGHYISLEAIMTARLNPGDVNLRFLAPADAKLALTEARSLSRAPATSAARLASNVIERSSVDIDQGDSALAGLPDRLRPFSEGSIIARAVSGVTMEELYVFLDPQVQALLADNEVDLLKELRSQGLKVEGSYGGDPATGQDGKERDVVLVILASAAAFTAISFGISRIVDAIGRNKTIVVEEKELVPVTDPAGKVVKASDGEAQLYWRTTHRTLDPRSSAPENSKIQVAAGGKYGVKFSLSAGD
jgi:hypothetical protein